METGFESSCSGQKSCSGSWQLSFSHATPNLSRSFQNISKIWLLTIFITTTSDPATSSYAWIAPFVFTSFYFPCLHLPPATLASLKFISMPGMFLFWGSCCSCSLCMQWSQLAIHLQTPLPPQVIAQISLLNKDSWTIQMKTTLYLSPRALPILISCFMCVFFHSTYFVSNIYMIYLIMFNVCCLPVTLGRDLCFIHRHSVLKNIGHTVGAKEICV